MCKHCWDYSTDHHKDFIRGGVDVDDFEKEVDYRPRKKTPKARAKKTRAGCRENNFGPHVYVWTTEHVAPATIFYDYYGYHKYEYKVCCGCGKTSWGRRETERYMKIKERQWKKRVADIDKMERGDPVSRWRRGPSFHYWCWEKYDEEFVAYRDKYLKENGIPFWVAFD